MILLFLVVLQVVAVADLKQVIVKDFNDQRFDLDVGDFPDGINHFFCDAKNHANYLELPTFVLSSRELDLYLGSKLRAATLDKLKKPLLDSRKGLLPLQPDFLVVVGLAQVVHVILKLDIQPQDENVNAFPHIDHIDIKNGGLVGSLVELGAHVVDDPLHQLLVVEQRVLQHRLNVEEIKGLNAESVAALHRFFDERKVLLDLLGV